MVSPKDMFLEISVNEEHFVCFFKKKTLKIQAFKLFCYLFVFKDSHNHLSTTWEYIS